MVSNRSVPTDTLLPHLSYGNVAAAVDWLATVFGFTEHYRYGDEDGQPSGAQMHLGDAWIMLNLGPGGYGLSSPALTVFVDGIDAHYERIRAAGARIVEDLHETIYGERQYGVEDLEGNRWLFSQHARDVSPDEWGATLAAG